MSLEFSTVEMERRQAYQQVRRRKERERQQQGNEPPRRELTEDSIMSVLQTPLSSDPSVLRGLAAGLLRHAVDAMRLWCRIWSERDVRKPETVYDAFLAARDAYRWLTAGSGDGISLTDVLDVLDIHPEQVLAFVDDLDIPAMLELTRPMALEEWRLAASRRDLSRRRHGRELQVA